MEFIVLGLVAQLLFCVVIGGLLTWVTGKALQWPELTYPNSVGLNLLLFLLNPFFPVLFFFYDYWFGFPEAISGLGADQRLLYGGILSAVLSLGLWFWVLTHIFGWDLAQSCKFCIVQALIYVGVVVVCIVVPLFAIIKYAQGKRAEQLQEERANQSQNSNREARDLAAPPAPAPAQP